MRDLCGRDNERVDDSDDAPPTPRCGFMYLGSPVFPLAGISEYVPCVEESPVYRVMVLPHELGLVPG